MTFTFAPLVEILFLHWAFTQYVIYMYVDDGAFVPPSDITQHEVYIYARNGTGCLYHPRASIRHGVCIYVDDGAFVPPSDSMPPYVFISQHQKA
ncbi:hypothetical protein Taro_012154 [Colocasia esculenta]|uniref:Uncharacterized protein n=1 Tax=Colocasia esculenta TaxID=4460 RepID=A0A843UI91_COLES|nr:hypothetical protein [Colocasia esculenta]